MRLSKNVKIAILNAAIKKAGIPERELAINSRYGEWAEQVRVRVVTPEVQALIDQSNNIIKQIPDNLISERKFLCTDYEIYRVNVAGQNRTVRYGEIDENGFKVKRISPKADTVVIQADDPLTAQLYAIDHDKQQLDDEKLQIEASVMAVLDSVATDAQLVKVWPEAVAFIPAAEKAATPNLPALQIADLNKMIGLP